METCSLCTQPLQGASLRFDDGVHCSHVLCPDHARTFLAVSLGSEDTSCPMCRVVSDLSSQSSNDDTDFQDLLRGRVHELEKEEEALIHRKEAQEHARLKLQAELERLDKTLSGATDKLKLVGFKKECAKSVAGYSAVAEANVFLKDLSVPDTPLRARAAAFHWFVKHALRLDVQTVGAALKTFLHFLQSAELSTEQQHLEVWDKVVLALLQLINSSRPDTQFLQLSILSELARFSTIAETIERRDGFSLVSRMLTSINEYVKMEACLCLKNLTPHDTSKELAVLQYNVLAPLYQLFRSQNSYAQERAVSTVWHLAGSDRVKERVAKEEGLSDLLPLLQSETTAVVESTCIALGYLTRNDDNKVLLRKVNGLGPLIGLLVHEDTNIQGRAAGTLWNCAADGDNKQAIRELGGIQPLLSLLYSDNPMVQENAAGAIWNLAVDQGNKAEILRYGGIEALVHQLHASSLAVLENVTGTLWNCAASTEARTAIRKVGAFPILLSLLNSPDCSAVARENVAGTLRSCAVNDDNKPALRDEGAMMVFTGVLSNLQQDESLLLKVASAVLLLSQDKECKGGMVSAGILPRLLACLEPDIPTAITEKAIGALRHCTTLPENKAYVASHPGALESIVYLLRQGYSTVTQDHAACTLWHCTRNESGHKQTVGQIPGAIDDLVHLLSSSSEHVQESAAGAVMSIAVEAANKALLGQRGAVSALQHLAGSSNDYVLINALAALKNMMAHNDDNCALAWEDGVTEALAEVLRRPSGTVPDLAIKEACGCLKHLAVYLSNHQLYPEVQGLEQQLGGVLEPLASASTGKVAPAVVKAASVALRLLRDENHSPASQGV